MIKGISNSTVFSTISKQNNNDKKVDDIEKSKVDNIKEAIQNGTYKLDINQTASKMAEALL